MTFARIAGEVLPGPLADRLCPECRPLMAPAQPASEPTAAAPAMSSADAVAQELMRMHDDRIAGVQRSLSRLFDEGRALGAAISETADGEVRRVLEGRR